MVPSAGPSSSAGSRPASPAASSLSHHLTQGAAATASPTPTHSAIQRSSASTPPAKPSSDALRPQPSNSSLRISSLATSKASPVAATTASSKAAPAAISGRGSEEESVWKTAAARKAERSWKKQSEKSLASDTRFKKYAATIDRALASFDSVNEWADFVGALARLEKIFSVPPPLPTSIIPRSLLLSKRLSQCLNPALPSGVHHRALSVYRQIFSLLSIEGLRRDISIWSPGLLPFFERSSTSTRPAVLALFEDFYLPLGEELRPLTRAFLLGILPGLDEEGGENFDRTTKLLDGVRKCVGTELFWSSVWASICGNPAIGQASVNFLNKRSPPIGPELTATIPGRESEKVSLPAQLRGIAPALASLLTSSDVLVVRGALDLLAQLLPLDSTLYHSLPKKERRQLVEGAVSVVQRRELSLNRRLWAWLGGSGREHAVQVQGTKVLSGQTVEAESEERAAAYLRSFGLHDLRDAFLSQVDLPPITNGANAAEESRGAAGNGDGDNEAFRRLSASDRLTARQKPFRIFLSLLDNWSVGSPLSQSVSLDLFRHLSNQVGSHFGKPELDNSAKPTQAQNNEAKELMTTASMLFDALDKGVIVGQCLREAAENFASAAAQETNISSGQLLLFMLRNFNFADEAAKTIHLPHLMVWLLGAARDNLKHRDITAATLRVVSDALDSCLSLEDLVSPLIFKKAGSAAESTAISTTLTPKNLSTVVDVFYQRASDGANRAEPPPVEFQNASSQIAMLQLAISSTIEAKRHREVAIAEPQLSQRVFQLSLRVTARLFRSLDIPAEMALGELELRGWGTQLFQWIATGGNLIAFEELQAIAEVIHASTIFSPLAVRTELTTITIGSQSCPELLYHAILRFLQADTTRLHISATQLFWLIDATFGKSFMQGYLCSDLLSEDDRTVTRGLEAFGSLWRTTSEEQLRSDAISVPLARVLDMLRSNDTAIRQAGETWLRRNIRSYTPIFETLLHRIKVIVPAQETLKPMAIACADGISVTAFAFGYPFNHSLLNYWLGSLLTIARYGAASFVRAAISTQAESSSPQGRQNGGGSEQRKTYRDHIYEVILRLLRADRHTQPVPGLFTKLNATTQALCLELLQLFATKGGFSLAQLADAESCVFERLLISIRENSSERQHRMLLAAHAIASTKFAHHSRGIVSKQPTDSGSERLGVAAEGHARSALKPHPLFLTSIKAGIDIERNRSVLTHWVDFVLMTLPNFNRDLAEVLVPFAEHLCQILKGAIRVLRDSVTGHSSRPPEWADADLITLIHAVERVALLCVDDPQRPSLTTASEPLRSHDRRTVSHSESAFLPPPPAALLEEHSKGKECNEKEATFSTPSAMESSTESGSGLFGYVTGIFTGDNAGPTPVNEPSQAKSLSVGALEHCIEALHEAWSLRRCLPASTSQLHTHEMIASKVQARCQRALERLYKAQSLVTVETLVKCWSSAVSSASREATFEILESLAPGSQIVVTFLCNLLAQRLPTLGTTKAVATPNQIVTEFVLLEFLEVFLSKLPSSEAAIGVWPVVIVLVKDVIANSSAHKAYIYSSLRVLTSLGEKLLSGQHVGKGNAAVTVGSANEDRRRRKELQETYIKIFDLCVLTAGKEPEAAGRGGQSKHSKNISLDRRGPLPDSLPLRAPLPVTDYLAFVAIPALRKFVNDPDKVTTCCSNAVYYIVSPALRLKSTRPSFDHVDVPILHLANEIARTVPGAMRALRAPMSDAFADPRFFKMTYQSGQLWGGPILTLHTVDRERHFLGELVARVTASSSANIFTNREAEIVQRCGNLRRLSFVLYSGGQDQFLAQLPAVQEKLVDVLRSAPPDKVAAETFLCLRILLMRFDSRHLTTLWPIIITELVRLFDVAGPEDLPDDSTGGVHLLLQSCKFIDLLMCLQTPEFQSHQWLFVHDIGDFQEEQEHFREEGDALFDRLASAVSERSGAKHTLQLNRHSGKSVTGQESNNNASRNDALRSLTEHQDLRARKLRQPLLAGIRSLDRLDELVPFLRTASRTSFMQASAPSQSIVDAQAIDVDMLNDLFEGEMGQDGRAELLAGP